MEKPNQETMETKEGSQLSTLQTFQKHGSNMWNVFKRWGTSSGDLRGAKKK